VGRLAAPAPILEQSLKGREEVWASSPHVPTVPFSDVRKTPAAEQKQIRIFQPCNKPAGPVWSAPQARSD
jgi:hypothetical protein